MQVKTLNIKLQKIYKKSKFTASVKLNKKQTLRLQNTNQHNNSKFSNLKINVSKVIQLSF